MQVHAYPMTVAMGKRRKLDSNSKEKGELTKCFGRIRSSIFRSVLKLDYNIEILQRHLRQMVKVSLLCPLQWELQKVPYSD